MKIGRAISTMVAAVVLAATPGFGASANAPLSGASLQKEVRQAINKLAYYDVFDYLTFSINEAGVVTLSGQVMQYNVRNSAVGVVKDIPGVTVVKDEIEVLPLSPYDNNIRLRAYNAIFGYPALSRYAINARPPIRILVKNGNVTLAGVVNNEMDRTLAYNRIQALPGVFSVTNQLSLDSDVAND